MNPFAMLMGEPIEPPAWTGPAFVHRLVDDVAPEPLAPTIVAGTDLAGLAAAAAKVAKPREGVDDARYLWRDKEAAQNGEFFLPLAPGQKRRRRAGPDGKPLKRSNGRYVRTPAPAPEPVYRGPERADGEMTYGAASRLIRRSNDGELVDLEELRRALDTAAKARAEFMAR